MNNQTRRPGISHLATFALLACTILSLGGSWAVAAEAETAFPASQASPSAAKGDLNNDGLVNAVDFGLLADFLQADLLGFLVETLTADLNDDGAVDAVDFLLLKRALPVEGWAPAAMTGRHIRVTANAMDHTAVFLTDSTGQFNDGSETVSFTYSEYTPSGNQATVKVEIPLWGMHVTYLQATWTSATGGTFTGNATSTYGGDETLSGTFAMLD